MSASGVSEQPGGKRKHWLASLRRSAERAAVSDATEEAGQVEVLAAGGTDGPAELSRAGGSTAGKFLLHSLRAAPKSAFAPSILQNLSLPGQSLDEPLDGIPAPEAAEDAVFDDILRSRQIKRREKHRSYGVIPRFYFGSVQGSAARANHSAAVAVPARNATDGADAVQAADEKRLGERDEVRLRLLRSWLRSTARARAAEARSAEVLEQGDLTDIVYTVQALRKHVPVSPALEDRIAAAQGSDGPPAIPAGVPAEPRLDYEAYCELRHQAPERTRHLLTPQLYMQFDRDHKGRISSRQLFQYLCALVAAHRRGLHLASMAAQTSEQAALEASKLLRLDEADEPGDRSPDDASPSADRPSLEDAVQEAENSSQGPPSLSEQDLELYLQDVAKEAPALARLPAPFVVFYVYTGVRRIVFMLQAEGIPGVGEHAGDGVGGPGSETGDAVGKARWKAGRPSGRYSLASVLACPAMAELGAIQRVTAEEAKLSQQHPAQGAAEASAIAAEAAKADPLLAGVPGGSTSLNWFSDRSALRVYGRYLSLDQDRDGLLSPHEMAGWGGGRLTQWFIGRLFSTCRTYDGMMDYRTYLDVELALAPRQLGGLPGHPSAVKMLFVCLDEDQKGYIDEHDVARAFFHVQCRVAEAMHYKVVDRLEDKDRARLTPTGFAPFQTKYCTADDVRAGRVENVLATSTFMAEFADMLGPWCVQVGAQSAAPGTPRLSVASGGTSQSPPLSPRPGLASGTAKRSRPPMPGVLPIRATLPQLCQATLGYSALRCLVDVDSFSTFDGKEAASSASPQPTNAALVARGAADGVNFGCMEAEEAVEEPAGAHGEPAAAAGGGGGGGGGDA